MPKALVTGASSGIGRAFAEALAEQGFAVTALARREDRLRAIVAGLGGGPGGGDHRALAADLTRADDLERVCADIAAQRYDLLVNNAGAGIYKPFRDTAWADIEAMNRLNCDALTRLCHAYLAGARAGDALVNVASLVGFTPYPPAPVYGATKAYVLSLSESLWLQWRDKGVYVMALCPGATDTAFFEAAGADPAARPPRAFMQTSEAVVATGLKALKARRRPTVIAGRHNNLFYHVMRFLSRKALVAAVARFSASKNP